jgi:TonB family protein
MRHAAFTWALAALVTAALAAGTSERLELATRANGRPAQRNGILELRPRHSWLRSDHFFDNFTLSLSYRLLEPDTQATLVVRAQTERQSNYQPIGYVITLPSSVGPGSPAGGIWPTEWFRCQVRVDLGQIELSVNGTSLGSLAVDRFAGYIVIETRTGAAQFRDLDVERLSHPFDVPGATLTESELKKQGGTQPELIHEVRPTYSVGALRALKQGVVRLKAVVLPDGTVGSTEVTRSLDRDLDVSALGAARQWKFRPATLNGAAVPTLVDIEMSFTPK